MVLFCGMMFVGMMFYGVVEGESRNYISWDDMKAVDEAAGTLNMMKYGTVIVVDPTGGGHSLTVQGAVDLVPDNNNRRVKIHILPGLYSEKVHVPATKPYISFIGNENQSWKTVITWKDSASTKVGKSASSLGTSNSASVFVQSAFFCASGITIQNTAVAVENEDGNQAVALRIEAENAMFYRVRILGAQDTLLDDKGKHYFLECYIQGNVDFICGQATSLYKNCVIHSTARRSGAIAAHHRESPNDNSGFSFVNCTINGTGMNYLGRAWGDYSRIVFSFCDMDDMIVPAGWSDWNKPQRQRSVVFGEYRCNGRGADRSGRVAWSKSLSEEEATRFMDMRYINGGQWLNLS